MENEAAWKRLGELLERRRIELGWHNRRKWVTEVLGMTHDRTHSDIENGRRDNYDPSTITMLEQQYQWEYGSIRKVLDGEEPATHNMGIPSVVLANRTGDNLMPMEEVRQVERESLAARQFPEGAEQRQRATEYQAAALSDLDLINELSRRLARATHVAGGEEHDGSASTKTPLSVVDDELPAAAKEGLIEEPGEFNT